MNPEKAIFESAGNALEKAQEYSVQLDPQTNTDVQSDEFIGTTSQELTKLRDELNEALINSNPTEQKRLAEDVQKRAIEIRDRLAEISISDAFRAHTEANKKLISEITEIHNTIKVFKGERIPAIIENLDPQRNGGITSEAFGEKLKPAILLFQEAIQAYDELLISTDKPTEQLTKLKTIQQQFLDAELAFQEIALTHYESDILAVVEKEFVESIVSKLTVATPPDNEHILAVMPGADQEEKNWNYQLLSVYSDVFATPDVPSLKTKPEIPEGPGLRSRGLRAIGLGFLVDGAEEVGEWWDWGKGGVQYVYEKTPFSKETVTLMDSLKKALSKQKPDGPDVQNRQGVFTDGTKVDISLDESSTPGEVKTQAENPDNSILAQQLSELAKYANEIETLAPIYVSLVQEHYLTLLTKRDRNNSNKDGRKDLPKSLQTRYDELYDTTNPEKEKEANTFTQTGLDSDGLDSNSDYDTFAFPDEATKMQFITSSIKLLPVFDTVDESYLDPKLEGFDAMLATGGDVLQYSADFFTNGPAGLREGIAHVIGEGATAAIGIFSGLHHPKAVLLSRLVSLFVERGEDRWYDLPLVMMILSLIRQARILAIVAAPLRGLSGLVAKVPAKYTMGLSKLFHIPQGLFLLAEKVGGGDGSSNMADYWRTMTRAAAERTIHLGNDISVKGADAVEKLDPEMRKRYDIMIKIIDMRIAAGEGNSIQVDAYNPTHDQPKTVELSGISPEFGQLLKNLLKNQISEEYCAQAIKQKSKSKAEKEAFKNGSFTPQEKVWIYMLNDMTASQDWKEQLLTGNIPDASNLNNSFGRIFGISKLSVPGTQFNWVKTWYNRGLGQWIEEYTWRINMPVGIPGIGGLTTDANGDMRNPAQALYHNRLHFDGWFLGRGSITNAGAYLDEISKHLPENLKVEFIDGDTIHHDVEALEKYGYKLNDTDTSDTIHFDQPNEQKLLKNCHFTGQFPKNGWKFAVVTMAVMARGEKTDLADDHAPTALADGHHHFDLNKCVAAYDKLSATDKKAVDALFDKILPSNHGTPSAVDRTELMKVGKLLEILPRGSGYTEGIADNGEAKKAIKILEEIYFDHHAIEHDTTGTHDDEATKKMETAYEKCWHKHAKEYSHDYEPKKHLALIKAKRKALCYMQRELLSQAGKAGYEDWNKIKDHLESKLTQLGTEFDVKIELKDLGDNSSHANHTYEAIKNEIETAAHERNSSQLEKEELCDKISKDIKSSVIRTDENIKERIKNLTENMDRDRVVALAEKMGCTIRNEDKNITGAKNALIEKYKIELTTKVEALQKSIQNPSNKDVKVLFASLRAYRVYPHSAEEGKADVVAAYSELGNKLKAQINTPTDYYNLYEELEQSSNNPENGAHPDTVLQAAYQGLLSDGKKQCDKFREEARHALEELFEGRFSTFEEMNSLINPEIRSVETKYGKELCKEGTIDHLKAARDRFNILRTAHTESQTIEGNLRSGAVYRRPGDQEIALSGFRSTYKDYMIIFGAQFNSRIQAAKTDSENARDSARVVPVVPPTEPVTPQTPQVEQQASPFEARQENARQLAQKIGDAMEGGTTAQDKFNLLQSILTDEQKVVAKRIYEGLRGKGLTSQEMLDALVQDILYAEAGDINIDAQARHTTMIGHPNLTEINLNLRRAGIRQIETTVNPNLRGGKK